MSPFTCTSTPRRWRWVNFDAGWAIAATLALTLVAPTQALARDLQGRLGLGYNNQFINTELANGTPAISLKYGLSRDLMVQGIFGISTRSPSNSVTAVKLSKNLFMEQNLNFYFFAGGGIASGGGRTGAEILSGFGAEFFIPGLESLGFAFETGAAIENVSDPGFDLRTLGVNILNAGVHFYF